MHTTNDSPTQRTKTGIVIVSYNAPGYVEVTLQSLVQAAGRAAFEVSLVDNGSTPENEQRIRKAFAAFTSQGGAGCYLPQADNLGFSGGNNVGIRHFLAQQDVTHICLLNSDVIVTDYWLDRLIALGADAVGPVSNAVGNEQTVPVDYPPEDANFPVVNAFAKRWHAMWQGHTVETTFLGFYAVLFSRALVERVGLLDTRFFPGSYEDDDYCVRIRDHGFEMVIARDIFLHHFGSASFSQLAWKDRYATADVNRRRFEEKYGRPWEDRSLKPLLGMRQDVLFSLGQGGAERARIAELYFDGVETQLRGLLDHNRHLLHQLHADQGAAGHAAAGLTTVESIGIKGLSKVLWDRCRHKASPRNLAAMLRAKVSHLLMGPGGLRDRIVGLPAKLKRLGLLLRNLAQLLLRRKTVLIFSRGYPTAEQEKDGYYQRVKSVDAILGAYERVYVRYQDDPIAPAFVKLAPGIRELHVHEPSLLHKGLVVLTGMCCRRAYYHSVLRMYERSSRLVMGLPMVRCVLDLHGVVPEEFRYHGDYLGGQIHDDFEALAVRQARLVITVTEAMLRHLEAKYGNQLRADLLVMPIFTPAPDSGVKAGKNADTPIVIYAGGLQKWQQIPKMLDSIERSTARAHYLLYVPHPAELRAMASPALLARPNVVMASATRQELSAIYAQCSYGFLLREDVVVNQVSCPTKLVEYLQYGIIPILDTTAVGDFKSLGMCYVSLEDFMAGRLPEEAQRQQMAATNTRIIETLADSVEPAGKKLLAFLA